MKSDVFLFKEYYVNSASSIFGNTKASNVLSHVRDALGNGTTDLLDVSACRLTVSDIFDFILLKRKFTELVHKAGGKLSFENDKFKLYDKEFETLDEVERALKNKAFL